MSSPEKKLIFRGFNHCYTLLVEPLSVTLARFCRRTRVWLLVYAVDLVRSLLSMCRWLLAYSFEPRPSSRALGTESIYNIRMLELKKPVWREETRWTSPLDRASATFQKSCLYSPHSRRQLEALFEDWRSTAYYLLIRTLRDYCCGISNNVEEKMKIPPMKLLRFGEQR